MGRLRVARQITADVVVTVAIYVYGLVEVAVARMRKVGGVQ